MQPRVAAWIGSPSKPSACMGCGVNNKMIKPCPSTFSTFLVSLPFHASVLHNLRKMLLNMVTPGDSGALTRDSSTIVRKKLVNVVSHRIPL